MRPPTSVHDVPPDTSSPNHDCRLRAFGIEAPLSKKRYSAPLSAQRRPRTLACRPPRLHYLRLMNPFQSVRRSLKRRDVSTLALGALIALFAPREARALDLHLPHCGVTLSDTAGAQPRAKLFERRDLWFALGTGGVVAVTASQDRALSDRLGAPAHDRVRDLASAARPLGDVRFVVPALVVLYGAGHISDRPGLMCSSERIGLSVIAAGGLTVGLKEGIGRARPFDSPNDPFFFRPFSTHHSFPSGHAAVAFSAAAAIDCETNARWVPWVVYPLASLVAWSRVHDHQHWSSDVVGGAAIGIGTARRIEHLLRAGRSRK